MTSAHVLIDRLQAAVDAGRDPVRGVGGYLYAEQDPVLGIERDGSSELPRG